ncbi:TonB-dependent receptor [bacterium]|nr:TonB-dependent receptor [bacterium]
MLTKKINLIIFTLLCLITIVQAEGIIRGYVIDAYSAEPLPVVNILVEGTKRGACTNLDGYFVIDNLQPKVYNLIISFVGYHTAEKQVVVTYEVMNPLKIELIPSSVELEDVVVEIEAEEKAEDIRKSPRVSVVPVDKATIRSLPSLMAETDVLRAIQTIPGVKSSSDANSSIFVRGGSPDQTLILLDHNILFNPTHMFGLFSTFNADAVKYLELKKGAFPAYYGGRMGSVLEVITNDGNRRKAEGMASIGIISARASLEGPLPNNKGSYAIAGRRTYMEPVLEIMRNAMDVELPDYYFYDVNGKVNFDLTDRTTLTVGAYRGNDVMDMEMGDTDNRYSLGLQWGNRSIYSRLRHAMSRNLFVSLVAAWSRYHSDFSIANEDVTINDYYNTFMDWTFKGDVEYMGQEKHKFKTGFWARRYYTHFYSRTEDVSYVDVEEHTYNYSIFAQDEWRIHPLFEIQPGIRVYYHEAGQHFMVDPRMAMVYYFNPQIRFKLAGGRYSQFINIITVGEGFNMFDMWVPVDDSVEPSYADQIVFSVEYDPKEDLQFTTEAYYTDMNRITNFDYMNTGTDDEAKDAFIIGDGYAYGLEWMLRRTEGRWTGWLGYSLSWTKRRFPGSFMNGGGWFYPKWDRRHDFIAVCNYAVNKRWDISATWRYNTGQGFTQGVGLTTIRLAGIDPEYWSNGANWVMTGEVNNYRFPADHRLDITASYKHTFFGLPAKLNISVYNAYNRRSFWRRFYNTNENPVEVEDVKLLPVIPLLSYEVSF